MKLDQIIFCTEHEAVVVPQEQPWGCAVPQLLQALLLHPGLLWVSLTHPAASCLSGSLPCLSPCEDKKLHSSKGMVERIPCSSAGSHQPAVFIWSRHV